MPTYSSKSDHRVALWTGDLFHSFKAYLSPSSLDSQGEVPPDLVGIYLINMLIHFRCQVAVCQVHNLCLCSIQLEVTGRYDKGVKRSRLDRGVRAAASMTNIGLCTLVCLCVCIFTRVRGQRYIESNCYSMRTGHYLFHFPLVPIDFWLPIHVYYFNYVLHRHLLIHDMVNLLFLFTHYLSVSPFILNTLLLR